MFLMYLQSLKTTGETHIFLGKRIEKERKAMMRMSKSWLTFSDLSNYLFLKLKRILRDYKTIVLRNIRFDKIKILTYVYTALI